MTQTPANSTHAGGGTPALAEGSGESQTPRPPEAAGNAPASVAPRGAIGPHASGCLVTAAIAALLPETKCAGCIVRRMLTPAGGA